MNILLLANALIKGYMCAAYCSTLCSALMGVGVSHTWVLLSGPNNSLMSITTENGFAIAGIPII